MAAKKDACAKRAANRKAQAKYQAKQPKGAQSKKVTASAKKPSTKAPTPGVKGSSKGGTPGKGQHGHQQGRPRKAC